MVVVMVRKDLIDALNSNDFMFIDDVFLQNNKELDEISLELLLYAIRNVNIDAVRFLLDKGLNISKAFKFGETILHTACNIGDKEIIELILQADESLLNKPNDYGVMPIHVISKRGNIESLLYLISKGALVEAVDENGETILHYAVISGRISILEYILRYTDISIDATDNRGKTALHLACEKGKTDIISYLIEMYANQDISDNLGNTPIFYTVKNGSILDTKILVCHYASIYALNNKGETIKDICNNIFDFEMIDYLDTVTNDIQFFENKTNSKLQKAIKCNDLMLVRTLLKHDLINELDDAMKMALYYAVCLQRTRIVELLLEQKDVVVSRTYLEIARVLKNKTILELLKRKIES